MTGNTEKEYEECMRLMWELIHKWEQIRPDEELVVMILPKYDQKVRKEYVTRIGEMLLRENWDMLKENGLPRA